MNTSSLVFASALMLSSGAQGQEELVHPKLNPGGAPSCKSVAGNIASDVGATLDYSGKAIVQAYVAKNPNYRPVLQVAEKTKNSGCDWRKDFKENSFQGIPNNEVYKFAAVVHGDIPEHVVKFLFPQE